MKLYTDTIWTRAVGTREELDCLRRILTPTDADPVSEHSPATLKSHLSRENRFYTGLVNYAVESMAEAGHKTWIFSDTADDLIGPFTEDEFIKDTLITTNHDPNFRLRDYQISAIRKGYLHGRGIMNLATGAGKTSIGIGLITAFLQSGRAKRALFVCPSSTAMLEQSYDRLIQGGLDRWSVGMLGAGKRQTTDTVIVALVDTLRTGIKKKKQDILDLLDSVDIVVFDEVHHLSSDSWTLIGEACRAKYRFGLTATLWEDPSEDTNGLTTSEMAIIGLTGKICANIRAKYLINRGILAEPIVYMPRIVAPRVEIKPTAWRAWHRVYKRGITNHSIRNSLICSCAKDLYDAGHKVLIFVTQNKYGLSLLQKLSSMGVDRALFASGGGKIDRVIHEVQRREIWKQREIADFVNSSDRAVIIGNQILNEGIDIPIINALILAAGQKKHRLTIQRCGRGMRAKEGDNKVYILDPYDETHPFLKSHAKKRRRIYATEEYRVVDKSTFCQLSGISGEFDLTLWGRHEGKDNRGKGIRKAKCR